MDYRVIAPGPPEAAGSGTTRDKKNLLLRHRLSGLLVLSYYRIYRRSDSCIEARLRKTSSPKFPSEITKSYVGQVRGNRHAPAAALF